MSSTMSQTTSKTASTTSGTASKTTSTAPSITTSKGTSKTTSTAPSKTTSKRTSKTASTVPGKAASKKRKRKDRMKTGSRTKKPKKRRKATTQQPNGINYRLLILFIGLLLLVIMGGIAYYVLIVSAPEPSEPSEPGDVGKQTKLVSSIVDNLLLPEIKKHCNNSAFSDLVSALTFGIEKLFQHGARAPSVMNDSIAEMFPNGAGELTDDGIDDTFKLGRFLGERYVKSGFLRSPILPSQIYFRSRSNNRCLMSGALVGSGMFVPNDPEFMAVPIYGQEKNDRILTHLQHCEVEKKRFSDKCGKTPPEHKSWPEYEGFVFECIGLNKKTQLFKSGADFAEVESLIHQDLNGVKMSPWFKGNRKEIYELYEKTISFIVGANDYHDKTILKLKQGPVMKHIFGLLRKRWEEWDLSKRIAKKKFIAYSTEDWLLMALMEALGCAKETLSGTIPSYNALLVIELSDQNGRPIVEVFYKDKSMDSLKDITRAVRGCDASPCPLSKFEKCCDEYTTEDPKTVCGTQS